MFCFSNAAGIGGVAAGPRTGATGMRGMLGSKATHGKTKQLFTDDVSIRVLRIMPADCCQRMGCFNCE
jgi:hypothetical protein